MQNDICRGYTAILLIAAGADSIEEMAEDARSLGVTLNTLAAAQGAKLTDTLYNLRQAAKGLSIAFGQAITPVLIASCDAVSNSRACVVGCGGERGGQESLGGRGPAPPVSEG